ncbi:hypothetical protein OKA04_21210 [Luteolibacter flavescens]|uniref:Uncharacterized protein n=1 Tax=Luteolibacter flavescens TaxID=1859460 RepID=A0ABT3FVL0_9BACT|nr:hypothetical protein [Luteolibacter flavescens]MCW1887271.1 hypothetical protein [Luteolibacter flavescens]
MTLRKNAHIAFFSTSTKAEKALWMAHWSGALFLAAGHFINAPGFLITGFAVLAMVYGISAAGLKGRAGSVNRVAVGLFQGLVVALPMFALLMVLGLLAFVFAGFGGGFTVDGAFRMLQFCGVIVAIMTSAQVPWIVTRWSPEGGARQAA